ncbi:MAG: CHAT domain-containing protein [Burkholderiales bacterium]|nr:CHAT domain-containing protein [Burkholderiales bacterium]
MDNSTRCEPGYELRRALAGLLLLGAGALPAHAQTGIASQLAEPEGEKLLCLPVHGTMNDDTVALRLAAPPLSPQMGAGTLQMIMQRLMGGGLGVTPPASATQGNALAGLAFGSPPATRSLVDGSVDANAGRHAEAQRRLNECAQQAAGQKDSLLEAACRNNLGVSLAAQGQWARARSELEAALKLYRAPRDPPADLPMPQGMGGMLPGSHPAMSAVTQQMLERMSPEQRAAYEAQRPALEEQVRASQSAMSTALASALREGAPRQWREYERLDTLRGMERTLLNLGNLSVAAGRLGEAEPLLEDAMRGRVEGESAACATAVAMDLARLFQRLRRTADIRALMARYRLERGVEARGEPEGVWSSVEMGVVRLAGNRPEGSPAVVSAPAHAPQATNPGDRTELSIDFSFAEAGSRFDDSALARLHQQAAAADAARGPGAFRAWRLLSLRAQAARRPDLQYSAHAALMNLHVRQAETDAAIFHGKRAANLAQAVRAALGDASPSRDTRRAFLRQRRRVYVTLAQLLLDAQRLQEAESVLHVLKEDEGQQFIGSAAGAALGTLALTGPESDATRQDDEAAARLRRGEQGRVAAVAQVPMGANVLLMLKPAQLEVGRIRAGLALPGLAAQLRQRPWRTLAGDEKLRAAAADLQDFFVGPSGRLERFLVHLLEDASAFDPPVAAADRTRLAETLKRVPQIQAELRPLLSVIPVDAASAITTTTRPGGSADAAAPELGPWDFAMAEPAERLWREPREVDRLEARHLQGGFGTAPRSRTAEPTQPLAGVQEETTALMARQPVPTALLYYLTGEQRLDALLVTAKGRRHFRLAVLQSELDAQIDDFAKRLRQPERDLRPAAAALYQRLFAPVAQAMADSGAQVLALSLSGKLRFVPFAALYSGHGWLVERYALAVHPGGTLQGRLRPASPNWRVAAFGASIGDAEFPPLLNVAGEIAGIVRQRGSPGGALPGEAWLDRAFTAEQLRLALGGGAQVVHVASHFKFAGGDAEGSYLLLGDGGRLSLGELAGPQYRFDRTELVTLSACTTGLSADDTYGQEVDGLAALLMGQGAPSVIASLWDVNDRSTSVLMASMYRLRESHKLSRVVALQQAQLTMIRAGTAVASPPRAASQAPGRGASRVRLPGDPEPGPGERTAPEGAALGAAHPFYWAPFVLMGNWL